MTYLLTQMALYMIAALLLGLLLGWLVWGRLQARLRKAEAERNDLAAQLRARGDGTEERARFDRMKAELDACRKERIARDEEIAALKAQLPGGAAAAAAAVSSAASTETTPKQPAAPKALAAARDGKADDLKLIKGVGSKLEAMLNEMGIFHFDQIAGWSGSELAWVDENLEGFLGRASRDNWIEQARVLAAGGETEFSARQG